MQQCDAITVSWDGQTKFEVIDFCICNRTTLETVSGILGVANANASHPDDAKECDHDGDDCPPIEVL